MRNALLVALVVSILLPNAYGATWRVAQKECGDPDEYESSRLLEKTVIGYIHSESGLNRSGEFRAECNQNFAGQPDKREARDSHYQNHQGFVINFSGSLFFLER